MQIEVSTGNQINAGPELIDQAEAMVEDTFSRFGERITRVIVHFGDENSTAKGGDNDKRCTVEVRAGGLEPVAVSANAGQLDQALDGALQKAVKMLDRTLERLGDPKGRMPYGGEPAL